jgi:copper homeostasis protein
MELEIVCTSLESIAIAEENGATRIELCVNLGCGGLTPTGGFLSEAKKITNLPLLPLIRFREGSFAYSNMEKNVMFDDMRRLIDLGADGLVVGALTGTGNVDFDFVEQSLEIAGTLPLTFHRAFDECMHPEASLRTLKSMGTTRVLTAGCAPTAADGIKNLQTFLKLDDVPTILPGGGIRASVVQELLNAGATELHCAPHISMTTPPNQKLFDGAFGRIDGGEIKAIRKIIDDFMALS